MLKKCITAIAATIIIFFPSPSQAALWLGAGAGYIMPSGTFGEVSKPAAGFRAEIMLKKYCKLWCGLRAEYFSLSPKDELKPTYYDKSATLSCIVRWAPFVKNCFDHKLIPYLQICPEISSISANDKLSRAGLGAGLGAGVSWNFKLFGRCCALDLDGLYNASNFILKDEHRPSLKQTTVGLTLSTGI